MARSVTPFGVMVKPAGPACNLACQYCFYLDKSALFPESRTFRMDENLLEEFIRQYFELQPGPMVPFVWQGGEPSLMGLEFFEKVVELQDRYLPSGWRVTNAFQTNGTLLTEEWCDFFHEHDFLVGISLDGPPELHDVYRQNKQGGPTATVVLQALHLLQEKNVEYNILCVVNDVNAQHPLSVYEFFRAQGVQHVQFIPLVEHLGNGRTTTRSVSGLAYGRFLTAIFNEWVAHDLGQMFVQLFEECLSVWAGYGSHLCVLAPTCGQQLILEHNGDLYVCDHFVFPRFKLGNLRQKPLHELIESPQLRDFGLDKRRRLPDYCRQCEVLFMCNGGCPKDRFLSTPSGEEGLNYLCAGYKQFLNYVTPFMEDMADLFHQRAPLAVMQEGAVTRIHDLWRHVGRNEPCPCGSGLKYKKCCQGLQ
ncbi:MAG: anaerobic sulfatase maturase [Firmicutes bacterium]|nr:anaerobic sulfatase maturase [Bacillota bacterium]